MQVFLGKNYLSISRMDCYQLILSNPPVYKMVTLHTDWSQYWFSYNILSDIPVTFFHLCIGLPCIEHLYNAPSSMRPPGCIYSHSGFSGLCGCHCDSVCLKEEEANARHTPVSDSGGISPSVQKTNAQI